MNRPFRLQVFLAVCLAVGVVLPAEAADRIRPGKWTGTTVVRGRTFATSSCISQGDAEAMNGDAKAVQSYLEKIIPPQSCKISDVKADGSTIVYAAACGGQAPRIITTTYHGTSSEGSDSSGSKTEGKLTGACK